jgi:hypothetical protein
MYGSTRETNGRQHSSPQKDYLNQWLCSSVSPIPWQLFKTMMNTIFQNEVGEGWLSVYMDDLAIHTAKLPHETEEQHWSRHQAYVHWILDKLEENDLYLKPEKCKFKRDEIEYLGVIVGKNHLQMHLKKLQGIADWSPPWNPTEVCSFLGFTGYYRYLIPNYSKIVRPLLDLTKKTTPWHWTEQHFKAFEELKTKMCSSPVLAQPNFDKWFYLQVDASAYGVGAILSQEGDHSSPSLAKPHKPVLNPVAYYSATFTPTERNYDVYGHELLGAIKSIWHWRPYLGWTKVPFIIWMDHANLQYWKSPRDLNRWTARWHADLQEYNYLIEYIPGKTNVAACHVRLSMAVLYLFKFYWWRPCTSRQASKLEDGLQVFAFNSQGGCQCEFVLELRDTVLLYNEEQGFESVCLAVVVVDL